MFRDSFLPVIERWNQALDHSVSHVNGVGTLKYWPALTEIRKCRYFRSCQGTKAEARYLLKMA